MTAERGRNCDAMNGNVCTVLQPCPVNGVIGRLVRDKDKGPCNRVPLAHDVKFFVQAMRKRLLCLRRKVLPLIESLRLEIHSCRIENFSDGGKISVSGDGALRMRGFIEHPDVVLPPRADGKLDVGGLVGRNGTLQNQVIGFFNILGGYGGNVSNISQERKDFSSYFYYSEQRPTAIALGVRIGKEGTCLGAGGVFLQPFPGAQEEHIIRAEEEIKKYASISRIIQEEGISSILARFEAETESERPIRFCCSCSREKAARAVLSLGKEEAERIAREDGGIAVHCHECNTDHRFSPEEIEKLFDGEVI